MFNKNSRIWDYSEFGITELMLAMRSSSIGTAKNLIRMGADLNAKDAATWTAFTHAVNRPSPRFCERNAWTTDLIRPPRLVNHLVSLLSRGGGNIGLREAVILGNVELSRSLIDAGTDPNNDAQWFYHDTFLMVAADLGHRDLTQFLLDCGADIEGTDDLGARALMRASLAGHADLVTLLIERGADINAGDWSGQTPLSEAATHGQFQIVDLLVRKGAKRGLLDAIALNDTALVERLLRAGADPNHIYYGIGHIATYAVNQGNAAVVRLLLDHGADHYALIKEDGGNN